MSHTDHETVRTVGPHHWIVVRRHAGRDLWIVEENRGGGATDPTGGALYTDRAQAEVVAEAHATVLTAVPAVLDEIRADDELVNRLAAREDADDDELTQLLTAWVKDVDHVASEPIDAHDLQCQVWNTDKQCDCRHVRSPDLALPGQTQPRPVQLACDGDIDLPEGA